MKAAHKTALLTGATGGIGYELARCFARKGYALTLVGRSCEKLTATKQALDSEFAADTQIIVQDLSTPDAAEHIVQELHTRAVHIDVLVNDAGFGYDAYFSKSNGKRQNDLVQVNVATLTNLCHALTPAMVQQGSGAILNVASIAGFMAGPGMATYYASKAYVQSFTQALHIELLGSGVHVTALCPGPVRTPFWNNADAGSTILAHLTTSPKVVARAGYFALRINKTLCIPGILPKIIVFASRLLPRSWIAYIAGVLQYKKRPSSH